ncbi:MAG: monovalent cation/H+ antiporter subunit D family protein [Planctomycetes bacterium]|nr:monovalent cation/H+ antiporter subunit D family protein [Planctomycetota bacterium]
MTPELAIQLALFSPCVGAVLVLLSGRWQNVRDTISILAGIATLYFVIRIAGYHADEARLALEVVDVMPGLTLAFEVEPLGLVYALVAAGLWPLTSLYAFGYMRGHHEKNQTRFFVCFAAAIAAALGIAFARNLFTLFLFYELLTFSTYPLVTHAGTEAAKQAGRKYLGILVSTSVAFLLFAIVWTYAVSGTLEFRPGGILDGKLNPALTPVLLLTFAFGIGKAALMPFHKWLPAAMVAPTPVSALLHAVAVVKAGVFSIVKIVVYVFGIDFLRQGNASLWLAYIAAFTVLSASVVALSKDNLKARLAYSTISQLAYIVLGAAIATPNAIVGSGMHIAMHAAAKITLFFCAGAIMVATHKTNVSQMRGLGRRMPVTFTAFFIASLSIIGLPPTGGSWSKMFLAFGAVDAHQAVFAGVYMLSSLLSIGYLMPVVGRAFFCRADAAGAINAHGADAAHGDAEHGDHGDVNGGLHEAPLACVLPLSITALLCFALFYFARDLYALLLPIVRDTTIGG